MTSYLDARKKSLTMFKRYFLCTKCICNSINRWAARYDNTNTHPIKSLLCGLAHGEVLPPDESDVSQDFTVPLRHFPQSCWAQWQSYETLKARSLPNLYIMRPITIPIILISTEYSGNSPAWKFYLSSRETCDPVCERHCPVRKRNSVYDYQKCQQLMLAGVAGGYWYIRGGRFPLDFHKVPYSPISYVTV